MQKNRLRKPLADGGLDQGWACPSGVNPAKPPLMCLEPAGRLWAVQSITTMSGSADAPATTARSRASKRSRQVRPPLIPRFPDNRRASGHVCTYRGSRSVGVGGLATRETVGAVIEVKATKTPSAPSKTKFSRARSLDWRRAVRRLSWGKPGDRQPLGTSGSDFGGSRGLLLGLAPRGPPDRLARIDGRDRSSSATRSRQKVCPAVYRGAGLGCRMLCRARRLGYLDSRRAMNGH
jgi:hypothetical protein